MAEPHSRRPHALSFPRPWDQLTKRQQSCLRELVGIFNQAHVDIIRRREHVSKWDTVGRIDATRVNPLQTRPGLAEIDPFRAARTVLLSGSRGDGKTTLLVSLLWAFDRFRKDDSTPNAHGFPELKNVQLLPLPIIDLPAMQEDLPLLSIIINSFAGLIREHSRTATDNTSANWEYDQHDERYDARQLFDEWTLTHPHSPPHENRAEVRLRATVAVRSSGRDAVARWHRPSCSPRS